MNNGQFTGRFFTLMNDNTGHQKYSILLSKKKWAGLFFTIVQEEVGGFIKENRAPQITVLVVGVVVVYLLPLCFCLIVTASYLYDICPIRKTSMLTCAMVNSLVNPLNDCWRQKEMRKVISKVRTQAVPSDIQRTRIRCASEKVGNYRSNFCFSLSKALYRHPC